MRVSDLSAPIAAAKADWLPGVDWLGFTPTGSAPDLIEKCQSTIIKQARGGYVIEYVTLKFDPPNPGYETNPRIVEEKKIHAGSAGCLVAIHKLHPQRLHLRDLVGESEFRWLQDAWAKEHNRYRWSVAFRISETYTIPSKPKASQVFDEASLKRWRNHSSGTLRPLNDGDREQLSNLVIERKPIPISWPLVYFDAGLADSYNLDARTSKAIDKDFVSSAVEGLSDQQKIALRKRSYALAARFIQTRKKTLHCDDCRFDPARICDGTQIPPRSLLDVHHKTPLELGVRLTELSDFELLCPTCHRFVHAQMRAQRKLAG